jgi:hypothetical protein
MGFSCAYTTELSRKQLLRATLAETPLIGGWFVDKETELSPRHEIRIQINRKAPANPDDQSGTFASVVAIQGAFEEGYPEFLERGSDPKCAADTKPADTKPAAQLRILCTLTASPSALYLPPGSYKFSVDGSNCQPLSADVPRKEAEVVPLEEKCGQ